MTKKVNLKAKSTNSTTKIATGAIKDSSKQIILGRDKESEVSPWLEDYLDLGSFRLKPMTQAGIERLAAQLIEWSKLEDSLVFRDFYDDRNIPEDTYYKWVRNHEVMGSAHALARGRIGSRREKGALKRTLDTSIVSNSMPMYDKEWKDLIKWKASLKDQSSTGNVTINVPALIKEDIV